MKRTIVAFMICISFLISLSFPISAFNAYETESFVVDSESFEASLVPSLPFTATVRAFGDLSGFSVHQKGIVTSQAGIGGMGVVANISAGTFQIYVARTTTDVPFYRADLGYLPSAVARVTDPDGNLAAVVDFSGLTDGSRARVITIPDAKAGNWTVQMMNGRSNDVVEIGISSCNAWGVRGEKILGISETMPETAYLYAPRTADYIYLASSDASNAISVYDEAGALAGTTKQRIRDWIKQELILEDVQADSVYQLSFPEAFSGKIAIDGITGLLCPTKAMAETLKGGWVDASGTMCQGPLQARAREELLRLVAEKDLSVAVTRPTELPENIENPMAEAQLFGATGAISRLADLAKYQITDVNNPYIGLVHYEKYAELSRETETAGFERCDFLHSMYAGVFAEAASIPLALNYAKGQEGYVTRAAMAMLYNVMMLSEDSYLRVYNLKEQVYPLTGGMFVFNDYQAAYGMIKDYLDEETRDILFQGLLLINDKQGDYRGQGVTNQGMFHMVSNLNIYNLTGIERYHNTFKRQLRANLDRTHQGYGLVSAGYFMELAGCDGSYEYMNRQEFFHIYNLYKKTKTADKALLSELKSAVEKVLKFEAYFCAPQPTETTVVGNVIAPNCFTTRTTNSSLGGGGNPSYEMLFHEFPMASRRMQVYDGRNKSTGMYGATAAPHHINNTEWALAHIRSGYKGYENAYAYSSSQLWPYYTYDAYAAETFATPAKLPCEEDDGTIFEENGFIGVKHQGIYLYSFYGTELMTGYYARNYAYMGGGPTGVWTEDTGVTLSSHKHLSGAQMPEHPEDIVSSCMFGYDAEGNFLFSGKEGDFSGNDERAEVPNTLTWLKQGEKFRIEGTLHNSNKQASWTYTLDEDGILVTAKMFPVQQNEEFWLNLPITVKDENLAVSMEEGKLTTIYNGDSERFMTYSWNPDQEAELLDTEPTYKVKRLRIKLGKDGTATFRIATKLPDVQMVDFGFYKQDGSRFTKTESLTRNALQTAMMKFRNNSAEKKSVSLILAAYDAKGALYDVIFTERALTPGAVEGVNTGIMVDDKVFRVKVMVLDSMGSVRPLIEAFDETVMTE